MLSNVGPEAGRAWCSVVRDTGVVESISFNSAERFECWWEGFQQRGCRLATPSPGEASVSRLDKSTPLPSRIDSDVSATRTSAWSCARQTTKMPISPIAKFMLPISVRVGGRQKTALGNNRSGSPSQEKRRTGELPLSFHLPSHPSSLGSREDAFSLLNTDDKTRRAIRTQAGGGGGCLTAHDIISNTNLSHKAQSDETCFLVSRRTAEVQKSILQPQAAGKTSSDRQQVIDNNTGGGPGERWRIAMASESLEQVMSLGSENVGATTRYNILFLERCCVVPSGAKCVISPFPHRGRRQRCNRRGNLGGGTPPPTFPFSPDAVR